MAKLIFTFLFFTLSAYAQDRAILESTQTEINATDYSVELINLHELENQYVISPGQESTEALKKGYQSFVNSKDNWENAIKNALYDEDAEKNLELQNIATQELEKTLKRAEEFLNRNNPNDTLTSNETPLNNSQNFEDCENKLNERLLEIAKNGQHEILQKQFELTSLKVANEVQINNKKTFEELVRSKSKELNASDKENTIKKLHELYKNEGQRENFIKVYDHLDQIKQRAQTTSYWSSQNRFWNEDTSAFLLYHKLENQDTQIDESDIAITWYMQKLTQNNRGSATTNLNNTSTKVAHLLGAINGKGLTQDEIKERQENLSKELEQLLMNELESIETSLAHCFYNGLWKGECRFTVQTLNQELNNLLINADRIVNSSVSPTPSAKQKKQNGNPTQSKGQTLAGLPINLKKKDTVSSIKIENKAHPSLEHTLITTHNQVAWNWEQQKNPLKSLFEMKEDLEIQTRKFKGYGGGNFGGAGAKGTW